jgi:nucleotide-binding universal stress UspA family protein
MSEPKPAFEARPLTSARGWYVRVAWPGGKRDHIPGFVTQQEAQRWIEGETIHVEHEHPYQAIIDTAVSKGCDLIVMASHGRHGISALVLGSETVKVLTHCKIPVLVHR